MTYLLITTFVLSPYPQTFHLTVSSKLALLGSNSLCFLSTTAAAGVKIKLFAAKPSTNDRGNRVKGVAVYAYSIVGIPSKYVAR